MTSSTKRRRTDPNISSMSSSYTLPALGAQSEQDDNAFEVTVALSSKFHVFPQYIRRVLEKAYKDDLTAQMVHLKAGTMPEQPYRYSITSAQFVRPSTTAFAFTTVRSNIACLSVANVGLLGHFLSQSAGKIKTSPRVAEPTNFVHLETQVGLANPEFIHLHAVRYGEIGYGFDAYGCLSLYMVEIVDQKHKVDAVFVQRYKIKVEEN